MYSLCLILLYCCGSCFHCHYLPSLSQSQFHFHFYVLSIWFMFLTLIHRSIWMCECVLAALYTRMHYCVVCTLNGQLFWKKPAHTSENSKQHHHWRPTSRNGFIHLMPIEYEKWRDGVILWLNSHTFRLTMELYILEYTGQLLLQICTRSKSVLLGKCLRFLTRKVKLPIVEKRSNIRSRKECVNHK